MVLTLGIETSCDETSCAVVEDGRKILSNVIFSQIDLHRKTGGVVPEVAAREHVVKIIPVLEEALAKAGVKFSDMDAIAVTAGPGLLSSLLIGINAAMTLAKVLNIPLIPVNHIEGHMYANFLISGLLVTRSPLPVTPSFPAAVLTVSGGHNELLIWKGHGKYQFLGATLDDAAGEAFDKVARLLDLPYPGGPEIQKAAENGDPTKYALPRPWVTKWDFSFSGLKTAVLRLVLAEKAQHGKSLSAQVKSDIAASFQEAVCEVLATKVVNAAKEFGVKEIHLAGGVSANKHLRHWVQKLIAKKFSHPPALRFCTDFSLCTDNAAMIAAAGYFKYKKNSSNYQKWKRIQADPNLEIHEW